MKLKIANCPGRCIIVKKPQEYVYRLARRDSLEVVEEGDIASHWKQVQPDSSITGAMILRSDFDRVRNLYGKLSDRETEMERRLGEGEFLIVLSRPSRVTYLHECTHALFHLNSSFRQKALESILRAPFFGVLSFAVLQRGYELTELQEEAVAFLVSDFFGRDWMLMTGLQTIAEQLRTELISAIEFR